LLSLFLNINIMSNKPTERIKLGSLPYKVFPKDNGKTYIYKRPNGKTYIYYNGTETRVKEGDDDSVIIKVPIMDIDIDNPQFSELPDKDSVYLFIKGNTMYAYNWNGDIVAIFNESIEVNIPMASTTVNGLMSSTHFSKLQNIELVNNLNQQSSGKYLDALQGKILKDELLKKSNIYNITYFQNSTPPTTLNTNTLWYKQISKQLYELYCNPKNWEETDIDYGKIYLYNDFPYIGGNNRLGLTPVIDKTNIVYISVDYVLSQDDDLVVITDSEVIVTIPNCSTFRDLYGDITIKSLNSFVLLLINETSVDGITTNIELYTGTITITWDKQLNKWYIRQKTIL